MLLEGTAATVLVATIFFLTGSALLTLGVGIGFIAHTLFTKSITSSPQLFFPNPPYNSFTKSLLTGEFREHRLRDQEHIDQSLLKRREEADQAMQLEENKNFGQLIKPQPDENPFIESDQLTYRWGVCHLYHVRLKSTHLGRVKAPQIDDHKSSCIVNYTARFMIVDLK